MIQKIEHALLTFISIMAFFAFFGVIFIDFRLFSVLIAICLLSSIGLMLGFWIAVKTAEPLVRISLTQVLLGAFLLEVSVGIAYALRAFNDLGIEWLIQVAIIGFWTALFLSNLLAHIWKRSVHFLPISAGILIAFASLLVCFAALQGHVFVLFLLLFVWLMQFITGINRFTHGNSIRYRWVTGLLIAWVGIATIICIFSADEFARRN